MNTKHKHLISQYIKAKDNNKPYLMKAVFSEQATLQMIVQTDNISFPADVTGVDEITKTLVREFNTTYENIYTLCFTDTVEQNENDLYCRWAVCMTEKTSKSLRIGHGSYQWHFEDNAKGLARHLAITIESMIFLPNELQPEILSCFDNCPYPWTPSSKLLAAIQNIDALSGFLPSSIR